jgi:hypothetical protein
VRVPAPRTPAGFLALRAVAGFLGVRTVPFLARGDGRPFERAGAVLAASAGLATRAEPVAGALAAALAARAAARRGLERCGRVRGSLESTPSPFTEGSPGRSGVALAGRSPSFGGLIGTSLLIASCEQIGKRSNHRYNALA